MGLEHACVLAKRLRRLKSRQLLFHLHLRKKTELIQNRAAIATRDCTTVTYCKLFTLKKALVNISQHSHDVFTTV